MKHEKLNVLGGGTDGWRGIVSGYEEGLCKG